MTPQERKSHSEAICRQAGIPVNDWLPVIENEKNSRVRNPEEVAWRAMCLCLVAMKATGLEQQTVLEILEQFRLEEKLSPDETKFVFAKESSDQDDNKFSWRFESYATFLWALGYVELKNPDQLCDAENVVAILKNAGSPEVFIDQAEPRSHSSILDILDLVYRYDWACVEARLKGTDIIDKLHPGVIYERHYALNWLVNYFDQAWDDISTDT
ncbi:MAG: DUF4272 domain-containing protein [Pyrinomonadaceae bacterium]